MVAEEEEVVEAVEVPTVEAGAEWPGEDSPVSPAVQLAPCSHLPLHTIPCTLSCHFVLTLFVVLRVRMKIFE